MTKLWVMDASNSIETMAPAYDPKQVEKRIYQFWMEGHWFHSEPDSSKKPYVVMMPLPNVTGVLHTGHALNNSLPDICIRYHRMKGDNAMWMPGQDHAGVATQIVVEKDLFKKEGKSRFDIGREEFTKRVWMWKEQNGNKITEQLKSLGISCDWDRFTFTMDENYQKAVREVFCHYYDKGWIYRGKKVVNWCPHCQTVISDIEVEHVDTDSHLWHIKYPFADNPSDGVIVATTRPETMLGDVAVAVNPSDERYQSLKGKKVILPIANREIPVVFDEYVETGFGTGVVKITPAHDPNDYEVGRRQNLDMPVVMGGDGKMINVPQRYIGSTMQEARKKIVAELEEKGLLIKIESHKHAVGRHDKCKTTIEPLLSPQLFLSMKELAKPAIECVERRDVQFVPERWTKVYFDWMNNILDWPISRQCWWGHRIPIFYCDLCSYEFASRTDPDHCPKCGGLIRQDEDSLDTWFSSALWPFATLGWPEKSESLKYYYPTSVIITAYDIIFLWVARMIFSGLEFMGKKPFDYIYFTGLIRDDQGRKMSKSLANAIDPLDVIEKYGSDALRFTLTFLSTLGGQDINLGDRVLTEGRNFINKIWNASRFVMINLEGFTPGPIENPSFIDRWILSRLSQVIETTTEAIDSFDFAKTARTLQDFFWTDFCDWYIELVKIPISKPDEKLRTQRVLHTVLETTLRLLHPVIPFVTEEIWQKLPHNGPAIMVAPWPKTDDFKFDNNAVDEMKLIQEAVRSIRNLKASLRIHQAIVPCTFLAPPDLAKIIIREKESIERLARVEGFNQSSTQPDGTVVAIAGEMKFFMDLKGRIDIEAEVARVKTSIEKNDAEFEKINKLLSNEGFLAKAAQDVVEKNKERIEEIKAELTGLKELLISLGDMP